LGAMNIFRTNGSPPKHLAGLIIQPLAFFLPNLLPILRINLNPLGDNDFVNDFQILWNLNRQRSVASTLLWFSGDRIFLLLTLGLLG
jgi:hypothetical protein